MHLNEYTTLGRSGLRVSPLCLGTMTFGTKWGWGAQESVSRSLFDRVLPAEQPAQQVEATGAEKLA